MTNEDTARYMTAKELRRIATIMKFLDAETSEGRDQLTLTSHVQDANGQDLGVISWDEDNEEYIFTPQGWDNDA
jgi:hypothetical protein